MTYNTVQHITPVHFTHTFPSIHPRYNWVGCTYSGIVRENLCLGCLKDLTVVMVAPKCPGTEVREDCQHVTSCEACEFPRRLATVHWNHRKTIQLNIGMFWGVQAWLWSSYPDCCAPGERSKGMQVASWVEMMAAQIQCLVGYFEFDKKTWNWMYLPQKMMILWNIVTVDVSSLLFLWAF